MLGGKVLKLWAVCGAAMLFLLTLNVSRAEELFRFWPGTGASTAPGFVQMEEHPCGEVAVARLSRMPTDKNGALIPEFVEELDGLGRIKRRWATPVDYVPVAVRRHEILVTFRKLSLWIHTNGSFRHAKESPAVGGKLIECAGGKASSVPSSTQCAMFSDLGTGKGRILKFEGVCS